MRNGNLMMMILHSGMAMIPFLFIYFLMSVRI